MPDRIPGWYIDSVKESVREQVAHARRHETATESLIQTLSDRTVPGYDDLSDEEFCTALVTALAVAIRMLADAGA